MAGWDSYTQKATPEDNDTLMIKDTAAGSNKRTPFSGVWNWMLNKLANAVISQLETSNKSIIPAINELNSKTLGNIAYYDANTDHTSETARSQALIQVLNQFKNNNTNTYLVSVIRYYNGYYFTYVASIQSGGSSFYVLEYSASMSAINIWNVTRTLNSATITRRFSDDDTVLEHVISPVIMNDTVDINTGYVDLNFSLNEYFFFKFVCAAGNVSSVGNLYEENMKVGFSYYVPCGKGYIRFNIESLTRINILENTSGYNFGYIKALKK